MAWGDKAAEQYEKDQPSEPLAEHYVIHNGQRFDVPKMYDEQAYAMLARVRERAAARRANR